MNENNTVSARAFYTAIGITAVLSVISIILTIALFLKPRSTPDISDKPLPTITINPSIPVPTLPFTPPPFTTITIAPTQSEPKTIVLSVYMFDTNKFNQPGQTDYVTKVPRTTNRLDVATFAIEELIKGPNDAEKAIGMKPTFGTSEFLTFTSNSNCNGKDFSISITSGKATLKFCRQTQLSGDSTGYIVTQQIVPTLKQFSTVSKVRILDVSGKCFDDMSGIADPEQCYK